MTFEIAQKFVLALINLISLLLGFWVLKSSKRGKLNQYFGILSLIIILWVDFAYFGSTVQNIKISLFLYRLNIGVVALFLLTFYLFFVSSFLKEKEQQHRILQIIIGFGSIFFFLSSIFTNQVIKDVRLNILGNEAVFGTLNNFLNIFAIFVALTVFYFGIRRYSSLSAKERLKVRYFFVGIIILILANVIFNIIFPQVLNTTRYQHFGDFSFIFFLGFTAYAIVRHRLMDIRLVVARSVAYTILIVTLAGIYIGGVLGLERVLFPETTAQFNLAQAALRVAITLVIVFSFQPLRNFITRITDKIFFKGRYDPQELLDKLGDVIRSTIILIELLYKVLDTLLKEMRVTRAVFVLLKDGKIYETQAAGYKAVPEFNYNDILKLSRHEMAIYDEMEEEDRTKNILSKYEAAVVVPLKTETGEEGILLLGEKSSGDMYSTQDIQILEILSPEMAVAIQNAESYEKLSRWNVTLRAEVRRQTRKLEEANEHLKELDKAKDEFISMASHQLRTPLTAIKGYLSMLMEGDAGEIKIAQYDFINEAFQGANRMVGLINDLLNVSRMETGRFFLEPVPVDLRVVAQEEINQLHQHAKDKNIYLKFEHEDSIPKIEVDENKIRQVVMNFIDNAIYYTKQGGVTIKLYRKGQEVFFEVHDTGIGVPESQKENLFTKFYRADNARRVRPDGTGLGLYLAKKVVEDHGGKIIFESVEEKGSTFGFHLPIKTKIKKEATTPPTPGMLEAQMKGAKAPTFTKVTAGRQNPSTSDVAGPQSPPETAEITKK